MRLKDNIKLTHYEVGLVFDDKSRLKQLVSSKFKSTDANFRVVRK
jgi:hypothetical protein